MDFSTFMNSKNLLNKATGIKYFTNSFLIRPSAMSSASPKNRSINVILSFGKKGKRNCDCTGGTFDSRKKWCNSSRHTSALSSCHACFPETDFALYESWTGVLTRVYGRWNWSFFFLGPRFVLSSSKCGTLSLIPIPPSFSVFRHLSCCISVWIKF